MMSLSRSGTKYFNNDPSPSTVNSGIEPGTISAQAGFNSRISPPHPTRMVPDVPSRRVKVSPRVLQV